MTLSIAARAWLQIVNGGGRWTPAEVRNALCLPVEQKTAVDSALESLVSQKAAVRHEPNAECTSQRFSVTGDCMPPRGLSVNEIVEAAGVKSKC
jgi:hypothetical protein